MESEARQAGGELLTKWRQLTTSDQSISFMNGSERICCPRLFQSLWRFHRPAVPYPDAENRLSGCGDQAVRSHPENRKDRHSDDHTGNGETAGRHGRSGQIHFRKKRWSGEVVSALCEGLLERGIDVHLATLNLKKRFQRESDLDEYGWRAIRYKIDSERSIWSARPSLPII